jgi:hypothetical protein
MVHSSGRHLGRGWPAVKQICAVAVNAVHIDPGDAGAIDTTERCSYFSDVCLRRARFCIRRFGARSPSLPAKAIFASRR